MPELPEVESIRRSLLPKLLGRTVRSVTLHRRDVLVAPGDPFGGFARQRGPKRSAARPVRIRRADLLLGAVIDDLQRRGKQLAIIARGPDGRELVLVVQLGMSGQLIHRAPGERAPSREHVHAVWGFDDGRLLFRDPRRFGGLRTFSSRAALDLHWQSLGPDGLTLTDSELELSLRGSDRPIKAALLDQSVVAGVGNIYADEALFAAAIRPTRTAASLSVTQVSTLAAAIRTTLQRAIEAGGSTLRDYVDADGLPGSYQLAHAVYGRAGQPCPTCGNKLAGAVLAQRATVWCPKCQR